MNHEIATLPSQREIRRQLETMRSSPRLSNSPSQLALLETLVAGHLAGIRAKGDAIGEKTFPGFIAERSSDVRVTAHKLRLTLADYYANEGRHDLVNIEVLKGKSYRIKTAYNSRSAAVVSYEKCLQELGNINTFPAFGGPVEWAVKNSLEADPEFAPAHALQAEIYLLRAITRSGLSIAENIELAQTSANIALRLDSALWRSHVASGAVLACLGNLEEATSAFAKARQLSSTGTERDLCYLMFLVAVGKTAEVLDITNGLKEQESESTVWRTIFGLFLFAEGRLNESLGELFTAYGANQFAYLPRLLLGCRGLAAGEGGYVGLSLMKDLEAFSTSPRITFWQPYPGLMVHFYLASEWTEDAERELRMILDYQSRDTNPGRWSWDLAIAYTAFGDHEKALAELERASTDHHPFLVWLHVWPFFKELKVLPKFRHLIGRIGIEK